MRMQGLRRGRKALLAGALAAAMLIAGLPFRAGGAAQVQAQSIHAEAEASYAFDVSKEWDDNGKMMDLALTTEQAPAPGTVLALTVLIPGEDKPEFQGLIKAQGVLRIGGDWAWTDSPMIPELGAEQFKDQVRLGEKSYWGARIEIPFGEEMKDKLTDRVSAVTIKLAGYLCDYRGDIAIGGAELREAEPAVPESPSGQTESLKLWDFDQGIGGWTNVGWNYQYDGEAAVVSWASEEGMLKAQVDYSQNGETDWSQIGIGEWGEVNLKGANRMSVDLYFDPALLGTGGLKLKLVLQYKNGDSYPSAAEVYGDVDTAGAEEAGWSGLRRSRVTLDFPEVTQDICNVVICLVGYKTAYKGGLYLDNLDICRTKQEESGVTATLQAEQGEKVSVEGNTLTLPDKTKVTLPETVALVDEKATPQTGALYAYLKALGDSQSILYGHQNDTWHKAGSRELTTSDTQDVTGSISGVVGLDTLSLTGAEYSAARFNEEIAGQEGYQAYGEALTGALDIEALGEPAANVAAAARLTNINIARGAVITLSAHMPNFSQVKTREAYDAEKEPAWARYDFAGYSPNNLSGDVMNQLLPGGAYHETFRAYLDMIADYAHQVDGAVLFRPFHENTGSWFWWGAAFCDAEHYKNVFRYTVTYLRDEKGVHNFLYVYGPGSEARTQEDYALRYPGDAYVDMVGFDMYDLDPVSDEEGYSFPARLEEQIGLVKGFADSHGKLFAITETGLATSQPDAGHSQTVLHEKGNIQKDWYNRVLEKAAASGASYFLLWANFGKSSGYYTPYADRVKEDGALYGHEMLDHFISFYNQPSTIFASDQREALEVISGMKPRIRAAVSDNTGFILAPVAGSRILTETLLRASVSDAGKENYSFRVETPQGRFQVKAAGAEGIVEAVLTREILEQLGESADGKVSLMDGETCLQTIGVLFNIEEPEEDPYEIDGFEHYFGLDSMLRSKWATNQASGSSVTLSMTGEQGLVGDGEWAMRFQYKETEDGWAGATISKETDWSACNALRLYTIPDGNNQKTVVQINTADKKVYEVYLNEYEAYRQMGGEPVWITIPFAEFCERDAAGKPKGGLADNCAAIVSFGLWVNAIAGSDAVRDGMVEGTLIYDKITAVNTQQQEVLVEKAGQQEEPGPVSVPQEAFVWTPVTPEDIYRFSLKGKALDDSLVFAAGRRDVAVRGEVQGEKFLKAVELAKKDYTLACTFNVYMEDQLVFNQDRCVITMSIPPELMKKGREFAVIGVNEKGAPALCADMDREEGTITFEKRDAYAYGLCYRDK